MKSNIESKINKLLKKKGEMSEELYSKLVVIARKAAKRKKHLILDILEMESMVNPSKVTTDISLEKIEVNV